MSSLGRASKALSLGPSGSGPNPSLGPWAELHWQSWDVRSRVSARGLGEARGTAGRAWKLDG